MNHNFSSNVERKVAWIKDTEILFYEVCNSYKIVRIFNIFIDLHCKVFSGYYVKSLFLVHWYLHIAPQLVTCTELSCAGPILITLVIL